MTIDREHVEEVKKKILDAYKRKSKIVIVDYYGYSYSGLVSGIDRLFRGFFLGGDWYSPEVVEFIEEQEE